MYIHATFSPHDPNLIIYYGGKFPNWNLYAYDVSTKVRTLLAEKATQCTPSWSYNNWILFTDDNYELFKVRPNGDSLTALPTTGACFKPAWIDSGYNYIYYTFGRTFIGHADGTQEQIMDNSFPLTQWRPQDNLQYFVTGGHISTFSVADTAFVHWQYLIDGVNFGSGCDLSTDGTKMIVCVEGIRIYDFATGTLTKVIAQCAAQPFGSSSLSADNSRILCQRLMHDCYDENTVRDRYRLYLFNADGSGEQELILPE